MRSSVTRAAALCGRPGGCVREFDRPAFRRAAPRSSYLRRVWYAMENSDRAAEGQTGCAASYRLGASIASDRCCNRARDVGSAKLTPKKRKQQKDPLSQWGWRHFQLPFLMRRCGLRLNVSDQGSSDSLHMHHRLKTPGRNSAPLPRRRIAKRAGEGRGAEGKLRWKQPTNSFAMCS